MNADEPNYKELCKYCFEILEYYLDNPEKKKEPDFPKEFAGKSYPLFITWTKGEKDELRGNVGTFASERIEKNLKRFTYLSALKDQRFPPIKLEEVPELKLELVLLLNFEDCKNPLDWEVGKHGIEISFEDDDYEEQRATILPEVAVKEGWNQETAITNLLRKSGYFGKYSQIADRIKTKRYESVKLHMNYKEFQELKSK